MVKITNGTNTFEVTEGAYNSIYKNLGFIECAKKVKQQEDADTDDVNEEDIEVSEDEKFCEDLLEKPISSWNKTEVKRFAEIKGIDISGTKNPAEAKDIIKEVLATE